MSFAATGCGTVGGNITVVGATVEAPKQDPVVAQDAELPPFDPVQLHAHGPDPLTAEAVPILQRPETGLLLAGAPLAGPQMPFTAFVIDVNCNAAEQEAFVPPSAPMQLHVHGPVPITPEAVPEIQSPATAGARARVVPAAEPHTP
ncbi:MAG: hypothetical protein EPO08_02400 [Rhodospirillaceae bacterium]|nr:MAG: hypothetical protein EPO08_02400 [Rhodospirillaceae bacterium]